MIGRWIANNVGVLVTLGVLLTGGIYGYSRLENQVQNLETARVERVRLVDARLAEIEAAASRIGNVEYRVTASEDAIRQTNQRFDTTLATISARLAEINQQLGSLSTSVAVLTQRVEQVVPQRRTEVRPPG